MQRTSTPPKNSTLFGLKTVKELLSEAKIGKTIPTGCKIFNEFLGGGFQTGVLTEIYGEAGTGKTQFCVQFLMEALYDYEKKRLEGSAIYISTSKRVSEQRYDALINSFLKRHGLPPSSSKDINESILAFHTLDLKSFEKVIDVDIPRLISIGTKIKAVVIDNIASISAEMMESFDTKNLFERGSFLKSVSTKLKILGYSQNMAIIVVNNVISGFSEDYKKANKVVPALGNLWTNLVNERFKMHKYPESTRKLATNSTVATNPGVLRSFKVKLSSRIPRKELFFLIDNEGIKGITANI